VFEICLRLDRNQTIASEILLEDLGAVSISLEDAEDHPVFVEQVGSTPLWKNVTLTALFVDDVDQSALQKSLEQALEAAVEINKKEIHDQDWHKVWMQNFQPMQFGERLWVCPSWMTYPDPFAINIRLDPGLAFATELNAKNNGVDKCCIHIHLADTPPQEKFDVLLANVLLTPLIEFAPQFANILQPSGRLILSGILTSQLESLENAYKEFFKFNVIHSQNEWLLIEASLLN